LIDEVHPFFHSLVIACHELPFFLLPSFLILNLESGRLARYRSAFELLDLLVLDGLPGDLGLMLEGLHLCFGEEGDESFGELADVGEFFIPGVEDEEAVVAEKSSF
jgi:hypothetical protein